MTYPETIIDLQQEFIVGFASSIGKWHSVGAFTRSVILWHGQCRIYMAAYRCIHDYDGISHVAHWAELTWNQSVVRPF